jgi:hypothetical protein
VDGNCGTGGTSKDEGCFGATLKVKDAETEFCWLVVGTLGGLCSGPLPDIDGKSDLRELVCDEVSEED